MTVPIATSPGRSGFGPQFALAYDSGAGNGPFGYGRSLGPPAITRKTDKGPPRYLDDDGSDVDILSGAEDPVPMLDGATGQPLRRKGGGYERWRHRGAGRIHWRSISRDSITALYGLDAKASVEDAKLEPGAQHRIVRWRIQQSYDDKGNAIVYEYLSKSDADRGADADDLRCEGVGGRQAPNRLFRGWLPRSRGGYFDALEVPQ